MEFIECPSQIRITKNSGTLILLAGIQGSGKSNFAKKHFDSSCIISNDDLFYQEFKKSGLKDMKSQSNFEHIYKLTNDKAEQMLIEYAQNKPYTVFDSVGYNSESWQELICESKTMYSNIILLVVHPYFQVSIKQLTAREKVINLKHIGLRPPTTEELFIFWNFLEMDIRSKRVGYKTQSTYIIREPNNVSVTIE